MTRILGLGLVCMIQQNASVIIDSTLITTLKPLPTLSTSNNHFKHRKIKWDYKIQSQILAAHDWGELLALPFAGYLINNMNVHVVLTTSFVCSILFTGLFPIVTDRFDSTGAFVTRLVLGVSRAFSTPSIDSCVALYIPDDVRNLMYSIVLSGNQIASIVVNTLVAYYCQFDVLGFSGWQVSFFILCLLGIAWVFVWLRVRPSVHVELMKGHISKNHVIAMRGRINSSNNKVSFSMLLKQPALWCLFPCNIAAIWTTRLLMFYVPSFYRDVFRMPLMKNGLFSSLPFIALCFSKMVFSTIATWLEYKGIASRGFLAKTLNTLGFVGSGLIIVLCGSDHSTHLSETKVILYLTLAGTLFSATTPGFRSSIVTLSRDYTARVSSLCTIASMSGAIVLPYVVGAKIKRGTVEEWSHIFIIVAALNCVAAALFAFFGSVSPVAKEQNVNGNSVDEHCDELSLLEHYSSDETADGENIK